MDVPSGFAPFPEQGPFLVLGLRAGERHANHRGTVQGGLLSTFADCSLTVEGREIVRARAVWVVAD